jgi:F-type H+-transporting ATPase subunit a
MPATTSMNLTLAMGLFVFVYYNFQGFKHNGFKYLEHFTGHLHGVLLLFLGPILFVIETVSHMVRPMTLAIRLRSNINVDSTVHGLIMGLMKDLYTFLGEHLGVFGKAVGAVLWTAIPVPIVGLGLLVAVVQAFVFTLLTTIYIGLATAHEEH